MGIWSFLEINRSLIYAFSVMSIVSIIQMGIIRSRIDSPTSGKLLSSDYTLGFYPQAAPVCRNYPIETGDIHLKCKDTANVMHDIFDFGIIIEDLAHSTNPIPLTAKDSDVCMLNRNSESYHSHVKYKCDRELDTKGTINRISEICGIKDKTNDGSCKIPNLDDFLFPDPNSSCRQLMQGNSRYFIQVGCADTNELRNGIRTDAYWIVMLGVVGFMIAGVIVRQFWKKTM
jgi:hypothetical protein